MDTQLQERVDKLEAQIIKLRAMDVKFSRWNEARLDEIQKVNEKIDNTHDRLAGLDAAATGYNAWRNKADNTFQRVTGRLGELQQQNDLRRKEINTLSRRIDELTTETERISDSATHRLGEIEKKQGDHNTRLDELTPRLEGIEVKQDAQHELRLNQDGRLNRHRDRFTEIEEQLQSAAAEHKSLRASQNNTVEWCDKADYTLQRLTERLSDVEEKIYENSFTPDVTATKHPDHKLARMRHHSREMYTVLELYEKASNNMHLNYADEAMKKVLRKVRGNEE